MRLRLRLRRASEGPRGSSDCYISLNYSYYLSGAIYRWIEESSPDYASFLHDNGYHIEGTVKRFKHFCFSQLQIQDREIDRDRGLMKVNSALVDWYVSMPIEETLQHLVVGIFEKQDLYIDREYNRFVVEQVETLPEPAWNSRMKFRMLSPTTVSVPDMREGKFGARYLFHDDPQLGDSLRTNILHKYESLHGRQPDNTDFVCILDGNFISDRERRGRKISRLVTIKEEQAAETKVRGFMCPVTLEGNPELIRLAYESGLGEKNSLGFGFLETENNGRIKE